MNKWKKNTNPNKFTFLTPPAQCRAGFEPCGERRPAEQNDDDEKINEIDEQ